MQVFSNDDNERVQRVVLQSITEKEKVHAVGPYSIFKAMNAFSELETPPPLTAAFYSDNNISGIELTPRDPISPPQGVTSMAMNVKKTTTAKSLAVAIVKAVQEGKYPTLNAIGAHSTNNAIKALAIAGQKKESFAVYTVKKNQTEQFTQYSLSLVGFIEKESTSTSPP